MLSPYTIQTYKQITLQSNFRRDRSGSSHYVSRGTHIPQKSEKPFGGSSFHIPLVKVALMSFGDWGV